MNALAIAGKELRQVGRDPRTLAVILGMPALLLLFYGYVLSFDVRHVPLAVLDRDRTPESRALVATLRSQEYFDVTHELGAERDVQPTLTAGDATLVLVIPPGFGTDAAAGRAPSVQALIDGSNATLAQTAQGYMESFVASRNVQLRTEHTAGPPAPPLTARLHVLYNPDLSSTRFLLPGLVAFILMITCTVATALSVVREREAGTMEQLRTAPISSWEIIAGKAVPYGALALVAATLVMVTARVAFGLRVEGSYALLFVLLALFVVGAQGLGLLISSVTSSQQVAFQAATFVTMLPTLLLSGFVFPIRSMPVALRALTTIVPARYFIVALRGVVLEVLWPQTGALVVFAFGTLALAVARLRRVRL